MRRTVSMRLGLMVAALALVAAACTGDDDDGNGDEAAQGQQGGQAGSLLNQVRDRGTLRCGVNDAAPGLGFLTPEGDIEGFDIDFCRAIAAAVLGDPDAVELVVTTTEERFNALRAGEFDVLTRNTTWTSSRDGAEGIAFAHVNLYDGQGMMVRSDSGFGGVEDMDGTTVCVLAGTTTELNLADYFQSLGIGNTPLTFEENTQIQEAFIAGQCQGWSSDRSQLVGLRSAFPEQQGGPDALEILPDVMSKEPLAPAVVDGDSAWLDVVNWVVNGLILAEELEVTGQNVSDQASSPDDPQIAAMLGVPFEGGEAPDHGLGVDNDFMQDVLTAVGNYGEIYDRHLTPLELDRGLNELWTNGGIQYATPFR
ncbi:MAG TPA: amino acid ABC transporter substrate-binding protein [Actinomycetota bacterium]